MGKKYDTFSQELMELKLEEGLLRIESCSEKENQEYSNRVSTGEPLPDGVYPYKLAGEPIDEFYRLYDEKPSADEKMEYIMLKQLRMVKTIKNSVLILTTIIILYILIYIYLL